MLLPASGPSWTPWGGCSGTGCCSCSSWRAIWMVTLQQRTLLAYFEGDHTCNRTDMYNVRNQFTLPICSGSCFLWYFGIQQDWPGFLGFRYKMLDSNNPRNELPQCQTNFSVLLVLQLDLWSLHSFGPVLFSLQSGLCTQSSQRLISASKDCLHCLWT